MVLRRDHPEGPADRSPAEGPAPRLNLLLTHGDWRTGTVVDQLPCLLEPMGIRSIRAASGDEAAEVIRLVPVHIAVVDLEMPLQRDQPLGRGGGTRTLDLLRRLDQPPPTVVVRPKQPLGRESTRVLLEALRSGAFAVLDRPLERETMLEVMRRILRRYYAGGWPSS